MNRIERVGRNGKVAVIDPQRLKNGLAKPPGRANAEVYLSAKSVELHSFDASYLRRLRDRHKVTQSHFVAYFGKLLGIKLRICKVKAEDIDDLKQETLVRVLVAIRTDDIEQPERLGAFVNATCKNVLYEYYRDVVRHRHLDVDEIDLPDPGADLERRIIGNERAARVHAILNRLSARDRGILRALLQGRDKDEICRELGVERQYLRVLMHRAIVNFKEHDKKDSSRMSQAAKR